MKITTKFIPPTVHLKIRSEETGQRLEVHPIELHRPATASHLTDPKFDETKTRLTAPPLPGPLVLLMVLHVPHAHLSLATGESIWAPITPFDREPKTESPRIVPKLFLSIIGQPLGPTLVSPSRTSPTDLSSVLRIPRLRRAPIHRKLSLAVTRANIV